MNTLTAHEYLDTVITIIESATNTILHETLTESTDTSAETELAQKAKDKLVTTKQKAVVVIYKAFQKGVYFLLTLCRKLKDKFDSRSNKVLVFTKDTKVIGGIKYNYEIMDLVMKCIFVEKCDAEVVKKLSRYKDAFENGSIPADNFKAGDEINGSKLTTVIDRYTKDLEKVEKIISTKAVQYAKGNASSGETRQHNIAFGDVDTEVGTAPSIVVQLLRNIILNYELCFSATKEK